jgi:ABC-type multidrug transport system fused ATPase/permease subunit
LETAAVAVTSLAGGLLEALFLVVVSRLAFAITDDTTTVELVGGVSSSLAWAAAGALLLVLFRAVLAVASTWQTARLSTSVIADLRTQIASAYLRASWSTQHGQRSGRLQELLTTFTQQGAILVNGVLLATSAGFSLLALLITAVLLDPLASLVVIAAVLVLASVLRPMRKAVRRQARATASTGMEFATSLSEISQLGMEMHVFNVQRQTEQRVNDLIELNAAASRRLSYLRGLVPSIYTGLAYSAIVGGIWAVASFDSLAIESIGAVILVMLRSLSYGQVLQTSSASIQSTLPFLDSLNEEVDRLEAARLVDHGDRVHRVGRLSLRDVGFEYSPGVPVLRGLSIEIQPCEIVGIVGPSGSGKSTLVQLLLGLRSPTDGVVLAEGRNVDQLSKSEWARKVTFVPQQAHLVAGTVSENIRFLRDDVTQEMIEEASRLANLHEDVQGFADGYDRQVGEQGSHLSGGQQQRLIIARALVENPDVLILDEPTSALDVRSEHLIRQTLNTLREKMTIIIVAHRLSTLEICDRIMVIQDGELKGFDTPENLEKTSDFYREALILSGMR